MEYSWGKVDKKECIPIYGFYKVIKNYRDNERKIINNKQDDELKFIGKICCHLIVTGIIAQVVYNISSRDVTQFLQ